MKQMKRAKRYPSIGRCVYCGDADHPAQLTTEHIIPEALGGKLLFLRASCHACRRDIEQFEGRLLNGTFASTRAMLGIQSKKSKARENIKIDRKASATTLVSAYTHISNHPGYVMFNGLWDHRFQRDNFSIRRGFGIVVKNIAGSIGNSTGYMELFDPGHEARSDLIRLLAKIAHGYWVAENPQSNLNTYLIDIIKGDSAVGLDYFIGRSPIEWDYIEDLHHIEAGVENIDGYDYAFVDICLLSCFPVYSGYRVYVGSVGERHMTFEFIEPPASN